jgi:hypothetical protein
MAPACHVAALLGYTGIRSHAITCNCMKVLKHFAKTGSSISALVVRASDSLSGMSTGQCEFGTGASQLGLRHPAKSIT